MILFLVSKILILPVELKNLLFTEYSNLSKEILLSSKSLITAGKSDLITLFLLSKTKFSPSKKYPSDVNQGSGTLAI